MAARWGDYFLSTDFRAFWGNRLADGGSACVIAGVGFDPRAVHALQLMEQVADPKQISFGALTFQPPAALAQPGSTVTDLSKTNSTLLGSLKSKPLFVKDVTLYDQSSHAIGGRTALNHVSEVLDQLGKFRDVVVDISGMPRTIFFPILAFLCKRADEGKLQNLHVVVTEDSGVDSGIHGREYSAADYVHPFRLPRRKKLVWLPIVAQQETVRLRKIHDLVKADCVEICPVVPFPSRTFRRADDILIDLGEVLFEGFLISKSNILMCDEGNPFDVYRKILQIDDYYHDRLASLATLKDVTTVVSPLSSKMLSLGALLAAIERQLPICHAGARAYAVDTAVAAPVSPSAVTTEIWLTGEPYDVGGGAQAATQDPDDARQASGTR